jgi:hypothetical protein
MCAISTLDEGPSIFISDKPILSSVRMLHEDCDRKGSFEEKKCGHDSQEAWSQDELIGGKLSVIK